MVGNVQDLTMSDRFVREALREWADGSRSQEAAVELLIRGLDGRFARAGHPWMRRVGVRGWGLDCSAVSAEPIGTLSGGQQQFLRLVASLGGGVPVDLRSDLQQLDRGVQDLVLAAVAHAMGSHEGVQVIHGRGGEAGFQEVQSLHPWPAS